MTIGPYTIVRLLGKGGMSEVYEVENPRLGTRHALKLYTYPKDDVDVRRRFETEGRLLAKLSHPHIVRVTDLGTDGETGKPYFVMDLILDDALSPRSLADLSDGEADEQQVGQWYDDIREALHYIHGKGVVHRDLKLQNVMIGPDNHAVLTDFGISRIFDPNGEGNTVIDVQQTIVRMRDGKTAVMGSIGYMAPEVEMGMPATPKSDYYALGVIVYKLLTGTWCDARTDVISVLSTFDPVWKRILPKLLHANPNERDCLSYASEKMVDMEAAAGRFEAQWLRQKERGHFARHMARYLAGILCIALIGLLVLGMKVGHLNALLSEPEFADVFEIPAKAGPVETPDMPSQTQFLSAMGDALVLTHDMFRDLRMGRTSAQDVVRDLGQMWVLAKHEDDLLFDPKALADADENRPAALADGATHEYRALAILLRNASKAMKRNLGKKNP